mmetsp:Transcript_11264/g.15884  ORF Transcript_11264/g.15884 Transcript_11264/m.15884 type:complete len:322 (-) Transcript_11264:228-1193(-)
MLSKSLGGSEKTPLMSPSKFSSATDSTYGGAEVDYGDSNRTAHSYPTDLPPPVPETPPPPSSSKHGTIDTSWAEEDPKYANGKDGNNETKVNKRVSSETNLSYSEEDDDEESSYEDVDSLASDDDVNDELGNDKPKRAPKRSACHSFFVIFQTVTILANVCFILTEVLPIYVGNLALLQIFIRSYLALFSFIFVLAEFEMEFLNKTSLRNWIARGFLYTFLGLVGMEQEIAMSSNLSNETGQSDKFALYLDVKWALLFIQVTSWWMVAMGCLYFLFGLFCMKRILRRCRHHYQSRLVKYRKSLQKAKKQQQRTNTSNWDKS